MPKERRQSRSVVDTSFSFWVFFGTTSFLLLCFHYPGKVIFLPKTYFSETQWRKWICYFQVSIAAPSAWSSYPPCEMPKPLQLAPFDVAEQWLYPESLSLSSSPYLWGNPSPRAHGLWVRTEITITNWWISSFVHLFCLIFISGSERDFVWNPVSHIKPLTQAVCRSGLHSNSKEKKCT